MTVEGSQEVGSYSKTQDSRALGTGARNSGSPNSVSQSAVSWGLSFYTHKAGRYLWVSANGCIRIFVTGCGIAQL